MKSLILATLLLSVGFLPEANATGSYFDWDRIHYGRCFEYTDRGERIRQVPDSYCRQARGSYYEWSRIHPGRCFEYTPRGERIQQVPDSYCR